MTKPKKKTEAKIGPLKTVAGDQATLERNFDPGGSTIDETRRAVCYNPACPDYRVDRPASKPCGCRRTSVRAAR